MTRNDGREYLITVTVNTITNEFHEQHEGITQVPECIAAIMAQHDGYASSYMFVVTKYPAPQHHEKLI